MPNSRPRTPRRERRAGRQDSRQQQVEPASAFGLLLAWNEYLYQFLLLSSKRSMTVPVALAQFFNSDEAPWNYMMATAIVYAVPPVAIYYAFRRRMTAGLTMGGVKG